MPGESGSRKQADPEAILKAYFRQELEKAGSNLPLPPPLASVSSMKVDQAVQALKMEQVLPEEHVVAEHDHLAAKHGWPGGGFRNNLASLLLAACILGVAALALSCSPRNALASSIGRAVEGQSLELLKKDTIKLAGLVWQQGQEYFRQKHSGINGAAGTEAAGKENP